MAMQANAGDIGLTGRVTENEKQIAKLQANYEHAATKADIGDVRTEMEKLRTEMEKLRTQIAKLRAEMTWRIIIAMGLFTSFYTGVLMVYIEWRVVGG